MNGLFSGWRRRTAPLRTTTVATSPPRLAPGTLLRGLAHSATASGGRSIQQDSAFHLVLPGVKIVAVADGVGSRACSDQASHLALHSALAHLSAAVLSGAQVTEDILRQAFNVAHEHVRLLQDSMRLPREASPATTLIIAVETHEQILLCWAGDGGAYTTTGNASLEASALYPHSDDSRLIEYIGSSRPAIRPSICSFPKLFDTGHIILIGTDGLLDTGRAQVIETAYRIISEVAELVQAAGPETPVDPTPILETWVSGERVPLTDNCSLGLIITEPALSFWRDDPAELPGRDG